MTSEYKVKNKKEWFLIISSYKRNKDTSNEISIWQIQNTEEWIRFPHQHIQATKLRAIGCATDAKVYRVQKETGKKEWEQNLSFKCRY